MKRHWDIEDLIEHFTLVSDELGQLANKTGATRLGFAVLLKCFQYEGRFQSGKHEVPRAIVDYMAHQLKLDAVLWNQYAWEGRTSAEHRTQIRTLLGFREATAADSDEMSAWLVEHVLATDQHPDHLKERVLTHFKALQIEPLTADRLDRLIRSASATFEQTFCFQTSQQLSDVTRERLDALVAQSLQPDEDEAIDLTEPDVSSVPDQITWVALKTNPGPSGSRPFRRSWRNCTCSPI